MESAKKYVLVDPRQYDELLRRGAPSGGGADGNNSRVRSAHPADRSSCINDDDVKAKLHEKELYRMRKKFQKRIKPTISSHKLVAEVLESVPQTQRYKAKRLMTAISRHPDADFNETGEFVYKQSTIPLSHAIDLIADVLDTSKTASSKTPPLGWREFASALRDLNVPRELIPNRHRWKDISPISSEEITTPSTSGRRRRKLPYAPQWIEEIEDHEAPPILWREDL